MCVTRFKVFLFVIESSTTSNRRSQLQVTLSIGNVNIQSLDRLESSKPDASNTSEKYYNIDNKSRYSKPKRLLGTY